MWPASISRKFLTQAAVARIAIDSPVNTRGSQRGVLTSSDFSPVRLA